MPHPRNMKPGRSLKAMKILLQQLVIGISIGSIYALIASGYALV